MVLSVVQSLLIICVLSFLYLAFAPAPLLLDLQPEAFTTKPPVLEGALAPNDKLESAEKLYLGQLTNPECVDAIDGVLYTALEDGRIVELKDGKIRTVVRIGGDDCDKKPPGGCGRPNGIRFDKDGLLVVADPLRGVYKVNVATGEVTTLFSKDNPVNGKLAKGCNHPFIASNGDVYFSDVSTKWDMFSNYYEFVEVAPHGRVLRYDAKSKMTSVVVDNLYFPNGVQLSADEDFLIIAQSLKYNILKYHLRGSKQGQLEVLIDNLPGIPDNIHSSPRGTFWVGLAGARLPDNQSLFERLGSCPLTRKIIGRIIHIASSILSWLAHTMPWSLFQVASDVLEVKKLDLFLGPHYGFALEFDGSGRILRSLQSPSGHVHHISHALEHKGFLYLGSPFKTYIGKVELD